MRRRGPVPSCFFVFALCAVIVSLSVPCILEGAWNGNSEQHNKLGTPTVFQLLDKDYSFDWNAKESQAASTITVYLDLFLTVARQNLLENKPLPLVPDTLKNTFSISDRPHATSDGWLLDATLGNRAVLVHIFKNSAAVDPIPPLGLTSPAALQFAKDRLYWLAPYSPRVRANLFPYLEERGAADLFQKLENRQIDVPMTAFIDPNAQNLAVEAAHILAGAIRAKPSVVLGLATGSTPVATYQEIIRLFEAGELDFSQVRTVNLDEYLGLDPQSPTGYRYFMNQQLFDYLRRGIHERKLRRWGLGRVQKEENDEAITPETRYYGLDKVWQELRWEIAQDPRIFAMDLDHHGTALKPDEIQEVLAVVQEILTRWEQNADIGKALQEKRPAFLERLQNFLANHHKCLAMENTHVLNGKAADADKETSRYEELISRLGGIDIQILGIGNDGHIAFNEPAVPIHKNNLKNLGDPQYGKALFQQLRDFNEFQLMDEEISADTIRRLAVERRKARKGVGEWIASCVQAEHGRQMMGQEKLQEALQRQRFTIYVPEKISPREIQDIVEQMAKDYPEVHILPAKDLLTSRTHVVDLAVPTIIANARFFQRLDEIPLQALTMGLGTILDAKEILLLAYGAGKASAIAASLEGPVSAEVAASVLRSHPKTKFLIDQKAASGIDDYFQAQCLHQPSLGPRVVNLGSGIARKGLGLDPYTTHLLSLVTTSESGGSSGELMKRLNVPAMGKLRAALLSTIPLDHPDAAIIRAVFEYRFPDASKAADKTDAALKKELYRWLGDFSTTNAKWAGRIHYFKKAIDKVFEESRISGQRLSLHGANVGNIILVGAYLLEERNFTKMVYKMSVFLSSMPSARILPATTENVGLGAVTSSGRKVFLETQIARGFDPEDPYQRIFYVQRDSEQEIPAPAATPKALTAIQHADMVVLGPGRIFTSLIPQLLLKDMSEAIRQTPGVVVFVPPISSWDLQGAEPFAEIPGLMVNDLLEMMVKTLHQNDRRASPAAKATDYIQVIILHQPKARGRHYVPVDETQLRQEGFIVVRGDFEDPNAPGTYQSDKLAKTLLRIAHQYKLKKTRYEPVPPPAEISAAKLLTPEALVLTPDQEQLHKMLLRLGALRQEQILSERTTKILHRVYRALERFSALEHGIHTVEAFTQWVANLDVEDRENVRFYPIVEGDRFSLGINLTGPEGEILHWQLRYIPQEPYVPDREKGAESFLWAAKGIELLPLNAADAQRIADTGRNTPIGQWKEKIPIPWEILHKAQDDMRAFLSTVAQDVEKTILASSEGRVTFRQFLNEYPMTFQILQNTFPEEFQNLDNPIVPDWNGTGPQSPPILIKRLMQQIFRYQKMKPSERIADFSTREIPQEATPVLTQSQRGPLTVQALLSTFLDAIDFAQAQSKCASIKDVRFAKPPVEVFGQWLRQGGYGRFRLELARQDEKACSISDGALIFDVDKTLLAKDTDFSNPVSAPLVTTFIRLLKAGIPLRIISGGAATKQYDRILKPLEELLSNEENSVLENFQMFAGTGAVRLYYDKNKKRFVKDETFTISKLSPEGTMNPHALGDLISNLPDILVEFLKREDVLARLQANGRNYEARELAKILDNLAQWKQQAVVRADFGAKFEGTQRALYVESRDGVSATVSGDILHQDIKAGIISLRTKLVQYLEREGQRRDWPFVFREGGKTSIDITYKDVTKSQTAQFIMASDKISSRQVVYFGDEFWQGGNDFPLTDPRLDGTTLVHVGTDPLHKAPFTIFSPRVDKAGEVPVPVVTPVAGQAVSRELLYLFDSLDSSVEILPNQQPGEGVSYTLSLFYQDYPVLACTYFPHASAPQEQWFISSLQDSLTEKLAAAQKQPEAFVPPSGRDSAHDQTFIQLLMAKLLTSGVSVRMNQLHGGAYQIRRLIRPEEPLLLVRQGHVPKSKLGILGHAWLRGCFVKTPAEDLFPLNPQRLFDENERYESALVYFDGNLPIGNTTVSQAIAEVREQAAAPRVDSAIGADQAFDRAA